MPVRKEAWLCCCRGSRLVPFAVANGLIIGSAGGATAVADPGSRGSSGHGHSGAGASSQGGSSVATRASNPAGSVAGTLGRTGQGVASTSGSGRNPGLQVSSSATTQIVLRGTDSNREKQNAGLVAAPHAVASVPKAVAPVTNAVTSVPKAVAPVANSAAVSVPSPVSSGSDVIAALQEDLTATHDTDFVSNTMNFGLFTITAAADPDDNEFVAVVFSSSLFTDILTSGADPADSLGFGTAGVGVSGETVNTFETPTTSPTTVTLPFTDPLAPLFTLLVPLGF